MNYYEMMLIFSSALNEEEEKAQLAQIEDLLKHEKATIHLVDHWGKRKLAYPIKKQRQGYYEWVYVEGEPGKIAEVDRKLKMVENLLRFMILRMEKIQINNMHKEIARRSEVREAQAAPAQTEVQETVTAPETVEEQTAAAESETATEPSTEA